MAEQDDVCGVCGETRENHGDKQHEFNIDGQLIRKRKPEPPRSNPPSGAGSPLATDPTARALLRLTERLIVKGLLDGNDLVYVFGGQYVGTPDPGATQVKPDGSSLPSST